jgi:enolase
MYCALKQLLAGRHATTAVGDEGGFVPRFDQQGIKREYAALTLLRNALKSVDQHHDINMCLDIAAPHFSAAQKKIYHGHQTDMSRNDLIRLYEQLVEQYPIVSLEDAFDQDDWDGWRTLTERLGARVQLVGDDLFTTNIKRIQQGIDRKVANAVLIKPNQIGTVTETLQAINLCRRVGYRVIVSHRSGETNDTFIADLAVGVAADGFKAGAPVRGERVAKYNRLLEIEASLLGM